MPTLELTAEQYEHVKNVLVWAELYDLERNDGKNQLVFAEIRKGFDYSL